MKEDRIKDILFIFFLLIVLTLAIVYFTVPERAVFIENQIKWWSELRDVVIK